MSQQTSLDTYFKSKANSKPANNMLNNKHKKRSLSLTRSPRQIKSIKQSVDLTVKEEVICLSSSSEDLLTPPESKRHASSLTTNSSKLAAQADVYSSPNKSITSPNSSTNSSSTIVYNISPGNLSKSLKTPSKTGQSPRSGKKFFSPTKKRIVANRSPAKRNLAFEFYQQDNSARQDCTENNLFDKSAYTFHKYEDDKTLFLLSIIEKCLETDALKSLLDEESQWLLTNCTNVVAPGMRVVCRLFWRQAGWYQLGQLENIARDNDKANVSSPKMYEILTSLLSNRLLVADQCDGASMDFDDYVKLLKKPDLQQICKELKLKIQSKQDAVEALRKYGQSSAISNFFGGKKGNNSDRLLKILRSKTGTCYKLSDIARNTLYKLYVLMYLGIDFTIIREKRLELVLLHDKIKKETYPVDKNMVLDNASVVFENKEHFDRYLDAHIIYEKYINSTETQEKCDIVLQCYKQYQEIKEEDMLRYKSMPPWLRRFTPGNIYVKIMESGVQELKKNKSVEYYKRAVVILDVLISQIAFRQHKKAEWYAEKALILHKHLDEPEQAAFTLLHGFKTDLSEEAKDVLRPRAKAIAHQRNINLSEEHLTTLQSQGEQEHIFERNLPADHVYKLPMDNYKQRGKLKFEAHTEEGRSILSAEEYCILHYTHNGEYTHGGHWEGRIVTTIFSLLFWDIIYTKPMGVNGIFMSHFQRYPLDMFSEDFYINRKTLIDDRLIFIEESTEDMIDEMLQSRWEERPEYEVSDITRSVSCAAVRAVCRSAGARGLAALCRRLARHYGYAHSGFPDLTLWNVHTKQVKFVEVKTDADKPSMKQLQWMQYLRANGLEVGFCYVGANPTRCKARLRDTRQVTAM